LLIVACGIPKPSLITNRIYRTKEKTDNYWGYIKFYSDSTLINVSSSGRPKHLVTWFNKEKENVSKGKYNIKNDSIYFESISKSGKVYFEGIILNKKLILKSKSEINGFEDMKTYVLTRK
jgi:hypothetical protein